MTGTPDKISARSLLRNQLLPRLGAEWFMQGSNALLRLRGYCVQGISLYRLRNLRRHRCYYFVQLLTVPADNLYVTLGDTLKLSPQRRGRLARLVLTPAEALKHPSRRRGLLARLAPGPREFLFDLAGDRDIADELFALLREQVWPPLDSNLAPAEVLACLTEHLAGSEHTTVLWTAAMLIALDGDLAAARHRLEALQRRNAELRSRPGAWPATARDKEQDRELARLIATLPDQAGFDDYCRKTAESCAEALKLPKARLQLPQPATGCAGWPA